MTDTGFIENEERRALRQAVADFAGGYGPEYYLEKARAGQHTSELWNEAGKLGFLGVNLPEEYGGGGAGMYELSLVMEEMSAAGCGLLMMVVSPAINGTIISKFGTDEQKKRWIPGIADGSITMAFAITEPDAGSNSHRITTTARRDGSDWILKGQKVFISGIDQAQAVLVVGRTEDHKTGNLKPALFVVPTGITRRPSAFARVTARGRPPPGSVRGPEGDGERAGEHEAQELEGVGAVADRHRAGFGRARLRRPHQSGHPPVRVRGVTEGSARSRPP